MTRCPAVYLMANRRHGTIYTGVTGDLAKRVWLHKSGLVSGFCRRYNLRRLVYYELLEDMYVAIVREKQIKASSRRKKVALIERMSPKWRDLYPEIAG